MNDMNKITGMFRAPKDKRCKSFVWRAADTDEVWMCQEDPAIPVLQQEHLRVWPGREFVNLYCQTAVPVMVETHDFMDGLAERAEEEDVLVHVFPNNEDCFDVRASELLEYMQEELDRVE